MERRHKDIMQSMHIYLLDNLDADIVLSHLYAKRIISNRQKAKIEAHTVPLDRTKVLLDELTRSGPTAFAGFLEALQKSQNFIYLEIKKQQKAASKKGQSPAGPLGKSNT